MRPFFAHSGDPMVDEHTQADEAEVPEMPATIEALEHATLQLLIELKLPARLDGKERHLQDVVARNGLLPALLLDAIYRWQLATGQRIQVPLRPNRAALCGVEVADAPDIPALELLACIVDSLQGQLDESGRRDVLELDGIVIKWGKPMLRSTGQELPASHAH